MSNFRNFISGLRDHLELAFGIALVLLWQLVQLVFIVGCGLLIIALAAMIAS